MVAIALPWHHALGAGRHRGAARRLRHVVLVGEIGNYVPGGIWPVVGRGGRRAGASPVGTYASVMLSLGVLYLARMVVVAVLLPLRFLTAAATGCGCSRCCRWARALTTGRWSGWSGAPSR